LGASDAAFCASVRAQTARGVCRIRRVLANMRQKEKSVRRDANCDTSMTALFVAIRTHASIVKGTYRKS